MPQVKITKSFVDQVPFAEKGQVAYCDTELSGGTQEGRLQSCRDVRHSVYLSRPAADIHHHCRESVPSLKFAMRSCSAACGFKGGRHDRQKKISAGSLATS